MLNMRNINISPYSPTGCMSMDRGKENTQGSVELKYILALYKLYAPKVIVRTKLYEV